MYRQVVGYPAGGIGPEIRRYLFRRAQGNIDVVGNPARRESKLGCSRPVDIGEKVGPVQLLLEMDVHQTGNRRHLAAKILRDGEVLRPVVSDGSYINLRRNAEIEDLRGDIGGLEIENVLRKGRRKRLPQFLDIIGCRRVPLFERHQDHAVVDADRRPIHERVIVSARRQADIVDDHIAVAFRDDLANLVLRSPGRFASSSQCAFLGERAHAAGSRRRRSRERNRALRR